jgi:hypothetical protein
MSETFLSSVSHSNFTQNQELTPLQIQMEGVISTFVDKAMGCYTLAGVVFGGAGNRLVASGTASLIRPFLNFVPRTFAPLVRFSPAGTGFLAEAALFEMSPKGLQVLTGRGELSLLSLYGENGLIHGFAHSAANLLSLKLAGIATARQGFVVQNLSQSTAMIASEHALALLKIADKPREGLDIQFVAAQAIVLNLWAGMNVLHQLAPTLAPWEVAKNLKIEAIRLGNTRVIRPLLKDELELGEEDATPTTQEKPKNFASSVSQVFSPLRSEVPATDYARGMVLDSTPVIDPTTINQIQGYGLKITLGEQKSRIYEVPTVDSSRIEMLHHEIAGFYKLLPKTFEGVRELYLEKYIRSRLDLLKRTSPELRQPARLLPQGDSGDSSGSDSILSEPRLPVDPFEVSGPASSISKPPSDTSELKDYGSESTPNKPPLPTGMPIPFNSEGVCILGRKIRKYGPPPSHFFEIPDIVIEPIHAELRERDGKVILVDRSYDLKNAKQNPDYGVWVKKRNSKGQEYWRKLNPRQKKSDREYPLAPEQEFALGTIHAYRYSLKGRKRIPGTSMTTFDVDISTSKESDPSTLKEAIVYQLGKDLKTLILVGREPFLQQPLPTVVVPPPEARYRPIEPSESPRTPPVKRKTASSMSKLEPLRMYEDLLAQTRHPDFKDWVKFIEEAQAIGQQQIPIDLETTVEEAKAIAQRFRADPYSGEKEIFEAYMNELEVLKKKNPLVSYVLDEVFQDELRDPFRSPVFLAEKIKDPKTAHAILMLELYRQAMIHHQNLEGANFFQPILDAIQKIHRTSKDSGTDLSYLMGHVLHTIAALPHFQGAQNIQSMIRLVPLTLTLEGGPTYWSDRLLFEVMDKPSFEITEHLEPLIATLKGMTTDPDGQATALGSAASHPKMNGPQILQRFYDEIQNSGATADAIAIALGYLCENPHAENPAFIVAIQDSGAPPDIVVRTLRDVAIHNPHFRYSPILLDAIQNSGAPPRLIAEALEAVRMGKPSDELPPPETAAPSGRVTAFTEPPLLTQENLQELYESARLGNKNSFKLLAQQKGQNPEGFLYYMKALSVEGNEQIQEFALQELVIFTMFSNPEKGCDAFKEIASKNPKVYSALKYLMENLGESDQRFVYQVLRELSGGIGWN